MHRIPIDQLTPGFSSDILLFPKKDSVELQMIHNLAFFNQQYLHPPLTFKTFMVQNIRTGTIWRLVSIHQSHYFSFQPVPHDWCNKGMCYPVCGMMHIKEPYVATAGFLSPYLSGYLPYV